MLFQYNPNSLFSLHGSFDLLFFPSSAVTAETMRRGWSKCHLSGPWVQTIWIKICLKIKNLPLKCCYLPKDTLFLSRIFGERLLHVNLLVLLLQSGEGLQTPLKVIELSPNNGSCQGGWRGTCSQTFPEKSWLCDQPHCPAPHPHLCSS